MTVSEAIEKSQNNNWRSPIMTFAEPCPRCGSIDLGRVECGVNSGTLSRVVCFSCDLEGPEAHPPALAVRMWNEAIHNAE